MGRTKEKREEERTTDGHERKRRGNCSRMHLILFMLVTGDEGEVGIEK